MADKFYEQAKYVYKKVKRFYVMNGKRGVNEVRQIRDFHSLGIKKPILLSGFQKSGNTWTRFLFFNYFNILVNQADKTLTYNELSQINPHFFGKWPTASFAPGFSPFFYTHSSFKQTFRFFNVLYLYRNPLDTLISYYHWHNARNIPFNYFNPTVRKDLQDVNFFVLYNLDRWIRHYKRTIDKAKAVLYYDRMKRDTFTECAQAFTDLGIEVDDSVLRLSIELSSLENIRAMGRKTGQLAGIAQKGKLKEGFEFTRSGETKQYRSILSQETMATAQKILQKNKVDKDKLE